MDLLKRITLCVGVASAGACVPDLDTNDSLIKAPTVLAVVAEPAEPKAGMLVNYRALVVDGKGSSDVGSVTWFYCEARKSIAELGPVSSECFERRKGKLVEIGMGVEVEGEFPYQACSLFGPNPPPPDETGGGAGRAADPDGTGGYRLPVVLGLSPESGKSRTVLYEQRFSCGLAGVSLDTSTEFNRRYRPNVNPVIDSLRVKRKDGGTETLTDGAKLTLARAERVELEARWAKCDPEPSCDATCARADAEGTCPEECSIPVECTGQEDYVWFDGQSRQLATRTESLSLAWYTTAGDYAEERTGVPEDERKHSSRNDFTAPDKAGTIALWVVLRDSRGGVGFVEIPVEVR